jgi:cyclic pyranopterin phosphate synthase
MLLDRLQRPLRDLRISVTDRCNFRCTYCMPEEVFGERYQFLKRAQLLTYEEIARVTRLIVELGAVKVRLTGGEPLVRQDLDVLVRFLRDVPGVDDIALTTNGVLLPKMAGALRDAGLQRVTISLDSLDNAVFRQMNGGKADVADVLAGVQAARLAGLMPLKINCVVQRGVNDHTITDLARWAKDEGHTLRFIEYMDVGTRNGWRMDHVVPAREIVERIHAALPLEPLPRQYNSETALRFRYADGSAEIGVIASVTLPFCGDCSRMRLSPDGRLYTCLFATEGTDIRTPLRSGADDEALRSLIAHTWQARDDAYSEDRAAGRPPRASGQKVEMYFIGG